MADPCLNAAICRPNETLPLGYVCDCRTGFFGESCETDARVCRAASTCLFGGSCNQTANSSLCKCPEGKTGANCQSEVPVCSSIKCENGAKCVSSFGNWSCRCSNDQLYSGTYCENKASSLKAKEVVSRSFAAVAIACLATVITFVLVLDVLKYGFKIDATANDIETKRRQYYERRRDAQRKRMGLNRPSVAVRFQYVHA